MFHLKNLRYRINLRVQAIRKTYPYYSLSCKVTGSLRLGY